MTDLPQVRIFISSPSDVNAERERQVEDGGEGVYRPPRISATSMPTTETKERKERRPGRSATLDEYVSTELSQAPLAVPSIGSTITLQRKAVKYEDSFLTQIWISAYIR